MVMVPRLEAKTERQASALEEAHMVAGWAQELTPEWVRCLGAIAEAFGIAALEQDFVAHLVEMLAEERPLDELEVVIRQLRERDYFQAAWLAARTGADEFPQDSWIQSVAGNCARQAGDLASAATHDRAAASLLEAQGSDDAPRAWLRAARSTSHTGDAAAADEAITRASALATTDDDRRLLRVLRASARRASDPGGALEEALALHAELAKTPKLLAETDAGHETTELVLALLLDKNDRRALAIQQAIVDAKKALWGECPALWLERANLGTVHAQLGEVDRGRALIHTAHAQLLEMFGPDHPQVQMCARNLARFS